MDVEKNSTANGRIRDLATGDMVIVDGAVDIDSEDLQRQLSNWQTVLTKYRATTVRTDLMSVAEQVQKTLDGLNASGWGGPSGKKIAPKPCSRHTKWSKVSI